MTPGDQHEHDPFRPQWFESWRSEVYEYRHAELQRNLSLVMATMNHLDSVVKRMETVTITAEGVAATAEKLRKNWWLRVGLAIALFAPLGAVVLERVWK